MRATTEPTMRSTPSTSVWGVRSKSPTAQTTWIKDEILERFVSETPLALRQRLGLRGEDRWGHARHSYQRPPCTPALSTGIGRVLFGVEHSLPGRGLRIYGASQDGGALGRREHGTGPLWAHTSGDPHGARARGLGDLGH